MDLFGRIALHPLSTAVPGRYPAIGVEHENGIFGNVFDEQAKALFAAPQLLLVSTSLCQIARDLGESQKLSVSIPQRRDDDVRPEKRAVLLDAPTFVFKYTFGCGYLEFVLRPALLLRLLRIED
jgi:hypothetical protein